MQIQPLVRVISFMTALGVSVPVPVYAETPCEFLTTEDFEEHIRKLRACHDSLEELHSRRDLAAHRAFVLGRFEEIRPDGSAAHAAAYFKEAARLMPQHSPYRTKLEEIQKRKQPELPRELAIKDQKSKL